MTPEFCSPFDESLARSGPAAVFLMDSKNTWRHHPNWTRDAYGRAEGPHSHEWTWTLLRDHGTGFVLLALVTSPTLLTEHPRMSVRAYQDFEAADAARAAFGTPPLAPDPWS